jgi:primosomal protein N'
MTNEEAIKILSKVTLAYEIGKVTITQKEINEALDMAIKALEQQPKTGHWIFHKPFDNGCKNCNECIECSQCHIWLNYDFYAKTQYCPNCGADMRGEDNGE